MEWVAISFSRGSSQPRDRTQVSHIAGRRFNLWATWEAYILINPSEVENNPVEMHLIHLSYEAS